MDLYPDDPCSNSGYMRKYAWNFVCRMCICASDNSLGHDNLWKKIGAYSTHPIPVQLGIQIHKMIVCVIL